MVILGVSRTPDRGRQMSIMRGANWDMGDRGDRVHDLVMHGVHVGMGGDWTRLLGDDVEGMLVMQGLRTLIGQLRMSHNLLLVLVLRS